MKHSQELEMLIEQVQSEFLELRIAYQMGPSDNVKECAKLIQKACQDIILLASDR